MVNAPGETKSIVSWHLSCGLSDSGQGSRTTQEQFFPTNTKGERYSTHVLKVMTAYKKEENHLVSLSKLYQRVAEGEKEN